MNNRNLCVKASMVLVLISTLAISSTILASNSALASLGESLEKKQKKDQRCAGEKHTLNFCSGYYRGRGDCDDGNKYRGNDKHHTKNWRDGYKLGWTHGISHGCMLPR
ncbi:MAG TPA: hypothetical protein VE130_08845 [Nitrososphaeraceae archaeon]|nr:hypothetical protein [Nitrososphaeraceae archaeon]